MNIHTNLRSRSSNIRWHPSGPREERGRMYSKPTSSDIGNVSKKSVSWLFGFGMGGLGCELGTTEDVTG